MKKTRLFNNEFYLTIIFIILCCIGMILFSNWRKDKCLKNGGKVIETNFGIMEKCVIGE